MEYSFFLQASLYFLVLCVFIDVNKETLLSTFSTDPTIDLRNIDIAKRTQCEAFSRSILTATKAPMALKRNVIVLEDFIRIIDEIFCIKKYRRILIVIYVFFLSFDRIIYFMSRNYSDRSGNVESCKRLLHTHIQLITCPLLPSSVKYFRRSSVQY